MHEDEEILKLMLIDIINEPYPIPRVKSKKPFPVIFVPKNGIYGDWFFDPDDFFIRLNTYYGPVEGIIGITTY